MTHRDRVHLSLSLIHLRLRSVRELVYSSCIEVKVNEITTYVNELLKNQDQLKTEEGAYLTENDPMVSIIARDLRFRKEPVDKASVRNEIMNRYNTLKKLERPIMRKILFFYIFLRGSIELRWSKTLTPSFGRT